VSAARRSICLRCVSSAGTDAVWLAACGAFASVTSKARFGSPSAALHQIGGRTLRAVRQLAVLVGAGRRAAAWRTAHSSPGLAAMVAEAERNAVRSAAVRPRPPPRRAERFAGHTMTVAKRGTISCQGWRHWLSLGAQLGRWAAASRRDAGAVERGGLENRQHPSRHISAYPLTSGFLRISGQRCEP
jgi:hypothetical protein